MYHDVLPRVTSHPVLVVCHSLPQRGTEEHHLKQDRERSRSIVPVTPIIQIVIMISKHSKRDAIHEEKKDDSMYSHGEVVSDDGDVEVALSPHSPEDGGDEVAPSTTPSASTTASAAAKEEPPNKSWCRKLIDFYNEYDFLILLIVVILLAYAYPPLGADYLQPQITATWIAVMFIFCKFFIVHVLVALVPLGSLRFTTTHKHGST